ncbi:YecA family protein [Paenibacillus pini]|nr:SEC-C metal-binding domain-containing protein [Paenibacillus pini]
MEQRNIKHAIIGDIMTSLPEILLSVTKSKLSSLASVNNISGRSKMKKDELADALLKYITDPDQLKSSLLVTDEEEWTLFESLLREPSIQDNSLPYGDYAYYLERGLVVTYFNDNKFYIIMPDEVKAAAEQINMQELKKGRSRRQISYQYILAAVQLYGVIEPSKLIEIFNQQNDEQLTEQELTEYIDEMLVRGQSIALHDGYIVNSYLVNDEGDKDILALRASQKDKPYYVPNQEEFLRYADETYFEITPQLIALQQYVLAELCNDEEMVEYLIDDIQLACSKGSSIQDLIYEFESRNIHFKTAMQAQNTVAMLAEIHNHTRMWSNAGHTLVELQELAGSNEEQELLRLVGSQESPQNSVPKVGRNEPCPCGSGLKYKKCCGK